MSWTESVNFREIMAVPDVRRAIDDNMRAYKPTMSAEDFLGKAETVLSALSGTGAPLKLIGEVVAPLYTKMGVKTGKSVSARLAMPPGRAIAAALCSMARHGQTLDKADQASDGVALTAQLPSDMWSFQGSMVCAFARDGDGVKVDAATTIPGQMFDWGKSERILKTLQSEIVSLETLLP
ncbi:MAG: hypothetical protein ABUL42_00580 [Terricaulis silvestris]